MHRAVPIAVTIAIALASSIASADVKATPPPAPMVTDDCAKATAAHRPCVLDLSSEDLEGHKPVQQGIDAIVVTWSKLGSLLHIRRDFVHEIVTSADELD